STQATVLALKALLAGTGTPPGGDRPRRIVIALDGEVLQELTIPADQADVLRQVDLSGRLAASPGTHRLRLEDRSAAEPRYQVVSRYPEPDRAGRRDAAGARDTGPRATGMDYARTSIAVAQAVTATATVVNNRREPAPMVILDLPIPAGFALDPDDLA